MYAVNANIKNYPMNTTHHQPKQGFLVLQVIKNILSKIKQKPEVYPIRYYKKNKRFRSNINRTNVK